MTLASSLLSAAFVWLLPVRGGGPKVHLVKRDVGDPLRQASLCGQKGILDRYGKEAFRRVQASGGEVCNACHAEACRSPSRVDWP